MNVTRFVFALVASAVAPFAAAQSGTADQVSPYPGTAQTASFNGSASVLTWQAEVQAGLGGTLEGFTLLLNGSQSSHIDVRVRMGGGWSTNPVVFSTTVVKQTASYGESAFVDVSSAGIGVQPGTLFVIEMQGQDDGGGLLGTYTPPPGTPQYSRDLYLGGPGCFADCGWRIAFTTYVLGPSVQSTCFGNGCPCGNDDATAGCKNSTGVGALLAQSGGSTSVAANDFALLASHMPTNQSGLIFMGNATMSVPFGDAIRCVGGTTWRFLITNTGAGGSFSLVGPAGQSNGLITSGSVWNFQGWYRDPIGPCSKHINMSNGVRVTFGP